MDVLERTCFIKCITTKYSTTDTLKTLKVYLKGDICRFSTSFVSLTSCTLTKLPSILAAPSTVSERLP